MKKIKYGILALGLLFGAAACNSDNADSPANDVINDKDDQGSINGGQGPSYTEGQSNNQTNVYNPDSTMNTVGPDNASPTNVPTPNPRPKDPTQNQAQSPNQTNANQSTTSNPTQ